ncbi:hypothetical protein OYE22_23410 [Streptomyces sp. 71268]|uniref:hypothetical protein n=1 Tax=Streptomyces sp. 71268 TaxID=3002640 RepID=UPI0023F935BB|nr:hypothetical protein [Streptomyces sp. 71268]WEV27798.1 hypothetical protein OYE22_23410 [Streptomyces sp. 71268]
MSTSNPEGLVPSLWIRETHLLGPLHQFFATRFFGPERRAVLAAGLPETQAAEQHHHEQRERALDEALRNLRKRRDRQFSASELAADTVGATARVAAEAMEAGRADGAPLPVCVAPPAGLEPAAKRLEGACAAQ